MVITTTTSTTHGPGRSRTTAEQLMISIDTFITLVIRTVTHWHRELSSTICTDDVKDVAARSLWHLAMLACIGRPESYTSGRQAASRRVSRVFFTANPCLRWGRTCASIFICSVIARNGASSISWSSHMKTPVGTRCPSILYYSSFRVLKSLSPQKMCSWDSVPYLIGWRGTSASHLSHIRRNAAPRTPEHCDCRIPTYCPSSARLKL
ncbi:uncharacterized protein CC84DRAFT_71837 [Paraphaeosphaeria sporulosa]|uniref:Uncharacterized protein n=1 Tax=Paraphaeosphaeria sporulosa TaxID=1460663 RepID=A0A177CX89_9PLEO|nr:uncharacterized protein CC84DRAFT_71837 [Paraphaeosphaeria sporulosa]OAG12184.1 hypothetical protein CC84DRAFT_71837 [Paraphaeosphaeria sporulosa]